MFKRLIPKQFMFLCFTFRCCVDCGKVVSQDIYTEDATFVKDSAGGVGCEHSLFFVFLYKFIILIAFFYRFVWLLCKSRLISQATLLEWKMLVLNHIEEPWRKVHCFCGSILLHIPNQVSTVLVLRCHIKR